MAGLANQAGVLAVSRIANYGLLLLSPIVLVRLLSVEEFGHYREFLVYASLLQTFAAFSIFDSLLYFIPAHPQSPWRVVRQSNLLTALSSGVVIAVLAVADLATAGAVVGEYLVPLALYTLLFVNLDFWERLWLATRRPGAVFAYSFARLFARMVTVIVAAALTGDVGVVIWSLIALEAVRFAAAGLAWLVLDRAREEPDVSGLWREMVRFCVPTGIGAMLMIASNNLSRIVVVRVLGAAALARYTIGTYLEPIVVSVRGSVSQVVLPEMVRRDRGDASAPLALWHRATVINAMLLFPLAVVIARFAEPIVEAAFGRDYLAAAPVLQIIMLVLVRECFDFAPPLRAVNRTMPIMHSGILALAVCAITLLVLLPEHGLVGAAIAVVLAKIADALYLAWQVMRVHGLSLARLIDWKSIGKTALAAAIASAVIADPFWIEWLGAAGVVPATAAFGTAYVLLLAVLRVPELALLLAGARGIARAVRSARG
jgi:O-antigen/teichoic acid export membrane protein